MKLIYIDIVDGNFETCVDLETKPITRQELDRYLSSELPDGTYIWLSQAVVNVICKPQKIAVVMVEHVIIGGTEYSMGSFGRGERSFLDEQEEFFRSQNITHIDQQLGMVNTIQGDQPDGLYTLGEWLEWARSIE